MDEEPTADLAWMLQQLEDDERLDDELTEDDLPTRDDVQAIIDEEGTVIFGMSLEGASHAGGGWQAVYRWRGRHLVRGDALEEFAGPFLHAEEAVQWAYSGIEETGGLIPHVSGEELARWLPVVASGSRADEIAIVVNEAATLLRRDASGTWSWGMAPEGTRITNSDGTLVAHGGRWIPESS
jgi:hypothetical protein